MEPADAGEGVRGEEAGRATEDDWTRLERDAASLLVVADLLEAGQVDDPSRLNPVFALVRNDLAQHHALMATQAWASRDTVSAGRALSSAARYARVAFVSMDANAAAPTSQSLLSVEGFADGVAARGAADESDWKRYHTKLDDALGAFATSFESAQRR